MTEFNHDLELDHIDMVNLLAKDGGEIILGLNQETAHCLHMAIGIVGEVAELTEALLNHDRINTVEELGDTLFYMAGLQEAYGIEIPHCIFVLRFSGNTRMDCILQMSIAAGDLLDEVKKQAIYCKEVDMQIVKDRMAILKACMEVVFKMEEITRDECLLHVRAKLLTGKNARYKSGYTDEAARERADKNGEQ